MKKFLTVVFLVAIGCASPAADYIKADQGTWAQFDTPVGGKPLIDSWIDNDPRLSDDKKDAFHQLNVSRRARITHAVAAINS